MSDLLPSSEDDLDPITKIKLESLRNALKDAQAELVRLRAENSNFRINGITCLTQIAITREYKEQFVSVWSQVDIERQMEYLSILEWHTQIFAELVQIKRRTLIKQQLTQRDKALVKQSEEYRNKPPKHVQGTINRQEAAKDKAIKAFAKLHKLTYESAALAIEAAVAKTKNKV